MSAEENVRVMRRVFEEVFDRRNVEIVDLLYAADYIYHSPGSPDYDRNGLKQAFAAYLAAFPDARMTVEDMFGAGDKVTSRYMCRGTQRGEFMGIPATGKRITGTAIVIHRLADGKVVEDWEWFDMLGFMQQAGAIPA